jgi:uncharacterized membrane protein (UPF0127 family)
VAVPRLLALLATIVLALGGAVAAGTARTDATAKLLLDGARLRPEVARTPEQRSRGLMHRPKAPADGMLFVFPSDTTGGFWMKNTLVSLAIVFFDRRGKPLGRFTMKPCHRDPCRIYAPERRYRFALELPVGDRRAAKRIGPLAALQRLSRSAT